MSEFPYIPPRAESPVSVPHGASRGDRIVVRFLGLAVAGAATAIGSSYPKEGMSIDPGVFGSSSLRLLAVLLLRHEGVLPFLTAVFLAGIGLILSFRAQARTRPMLAFVCASFFLTLAASFGQYLLIHELMRAAGF